MRALLIALSLVALSAPALAAPTTKALPKAPAVLPVTTVETPAPVVTPATVIAPSDLAARLVALDAGLHALQTAAGIPQATIPPATWDTPAGKAVAITLSVVVSLVGAGATAYGAYELARR